MRGLPRQRVCDLVTKGHVKHLLRQEVCPADYGTHCPPVGPIDKPSLYLNLSTASINRLATLEALMYPTADAFPGPKSPIRPSSVPVAQIRPKTFDALKEGSYISPFDPCLPIRGVVRLFERPQHAKKRGRIISWPQRLNEAIDPFYTFEEHFENWSYLKQCIRDFDVGTTRDIKAAFYHDTVPPSARDLFVFRYDNQLFSWNRKCMGIIPAAEHQQIESRGLFAAHSLRAVQIDDGLFLDIAANSERIRSDLEAVDLRCKQANVTLNPGPPIGTTVEFWGTRMDLARKTVTLLPKKLDRLREASMTLTLEHPPLRDILILVGRVLSATEILDIELFPAFYALKFYRNLCMRFSQGRLDLDSPIRWWTAARSQWDSLVHRILRTPSVNLCRYVPAQPATLFVDASTTGWGGLLTHSGRVYSIGHRWTEPHTHREINTLEVRAALLAIQHFLPQLQDVPIILKSDNTTALATLRHRRSHNFQRNQIVSSLFRTLRSCRSSLLSCEYISTHENPADPLSRSKPLRAPVLTACSPSACDGRGSPRNGAPWPTWNP